MHVRVYHCVWLGLLAGTALGATPALEIEALPGGRFRIGAPAAAAGFALEESAAVGALASWSRVPGSPATAGGPWAVVVTVGAQHRFFRLAQVSGAPARIVETSPVDGETGVSVNRETVFRFDAPLAAETVLDTTLVSATAAGRTLLTRVELATDRRSAALFYLEPLPSNTRIVARFDGFGVLDGAGRAFDADGDGLPGGRIEVTFTTANATPVGATAVRGRVFASEKNTDGTDRPLPGVTITVDGAEQTLRAVTDARGAFVLQPAPAGRFFVHVDGRTSPLSQWPGGAYYPFVGKAWEAEPGSTNNLANGDGLVFLPLVPADALQPVSATDTTVVTFPPSLLVAEPALAGVEIRVPPNALFANDGTRGGRVGLAPVAPDRLPEPLPPGLNLPLVITIQTDGPGNFDRPVPVRFPNLPDPITGEVLPPGAKTALWSFDHDTGRWEIAGPMTVTADGRFAETDPGVGVRQPGWHGAAPGSPGNGPEGDPDEEDPDDCEDANSNGLCDNQEPDPCELQKVQFIFSATDTFTGLLGLIPDMKGAAANCAMSFTTAALQGVRDCGIDPKNCFKTDELSTVTTKLIDFGIGCASSFTGPLKPWADSAVALKSLLDTGLAYRTFRDCRIMNPRAASLHGPALMAVAPGNPFLLQYEVETRLGVLLDRVYGEGWRFIHLAEVPLLAGLLEGIRDAATAHSPGGFGITPAERDAILARPRPANRSEADVEALIVRFEGILPGGDPAGFDLAGIEAAAASLEAVLEDTVADGWSHTHEGYSRGLALLQELIASIGQPVMAGGVVRHGPQPAAGNAVIPGLPDRAHAWWLLDVNRGFVRRGTLNAAGRFEGLILAPDTDYLIGYADPLTGRVGVNQFRSRNAGRATMVPGAVMAGPPAAPDRDADGLSDFAEQVVGTNPDLPDTDGDGVTDGVEFRSGGEPLGAEAWPLGVIGGADTPGEARDLAVEGDLAVVADGTAGLAVFDLTDPRAPVRLTQFALNRASSVALSGGLALVGHREGTTLLDVRSPESPLVITNLSGATPNAVALASPYGYFNRGDDLLVVDLATGGLLLSVPLPEVVHDLAVDGDLLHVLTAEALHIFRRSGSELTELSRTPISGEAAPLEPGRKLFAGGGRAYVGYFRGFTILDVTNPAAPVVRATQPRTQAAIHDFADNGSGLLAAITSFGGQTSLAFSLYDVRSGNTTTNFLASLPTPGDPFAVVLHRGLAYVADDEAGLQVLNYLAPDRAQQRPTVAFGPPLSNGATLEAGSSPLLTFATGDDVAVRELELYVNGQRLATAGSFPFQIPVTVAPATGDPVSVVLRARAVDTAGNERWTDDLTVTLTPDQTAPLVRLIRPAAGADLAPGGLTALVVGFSEPMDPASLPAGLRVTTAGSDGALGTADDTSVNVTLTYDERTRTVTLAREPAFGSGRYRLVASTDLADASGVKLATPRTWDFRVLPPAVIATTPANNSSHRPGAPAELTARFSTLMDAASLRNGGFRLDHAGADGQVGTADDVPVDVSGLVFSVISNRMAFAPTPPLRSGRYRAQVTTHALDVLGSAVAAPPAAWNFTVLAPSVTAVDPPDGYARAVGGLTALQVRFTDPMDPTTLAAGLQLALTNGTPVTGGGTRFDTETLTATLAFTAPLPAGEYRLRVTTAARDVYGNPLGTEFTSRFGVHGPVRWGVDADGRWDTAGNWAPARPIPGDDVVLDRPGRDVVISHTTGSSLVNTLTGTETLRLTGGNLAIQSDSRFAGPLTLQGGVLSNRANLRLEGPVTFGSGATVRGDGTMTFAGPVSLQGGTSANAVGIGGQTLVVEGGPLSWTAGHLDNDGRAANAHWLLGPGVLFEAVAGTAPRDWQGNRSTLWNRGRFRQTGGTGLLRWIGVTVTNDSVWEISAGQAELQGSLVQSGRLELAPGAALRISDSAGTVRLLPGGVIEGAGTLSLRGTDATFAGRYAVTGGSTFESLAAEFTGEFQPGAGPLAFINTEAVFDNGPLALANPITFREGTLDFRHPTTLADFRWEHGRVHIRGDLTVNNRLTVGREDVANGAEFAGPGRLRVNDGLVLRRPFTVEADAVIEHAGNSVWQPQTSAQTTALNLEAGAVFRNLAAGRFELATNRTVGGPGTFENLGTLVKAANPRTNVVSTALESSGTIEVAGGTLQLSGGGTLAGPVTLAAGATLDLTGANRRPGWLLSGAFTGAGRLLLRGGSNQFIGLLAGPTLVVNGATVRLPAGFSLTNAEIRSGTLFLDNGLRLSGTNSLLTGTSTRVRGDGVVRNDGVLGEAGVWFDGDLENAGEWNYLSSSRPRYGGVFRNLPGATYTVTNLTSSTSGGPDPGVFDNAGLLRQVGTGNARFLNTFTNRGVMEITGTLTVAGAFTQTVQGLTRLHGGTLSPAGSWRALAGEIHGPGQVGRGTSGDFYVITNVAHLRPGGPTGFGLLEFNATAAYLGSESRLTVRIGGTTPGTEHDQLRASHSLWLGGRLRLEFVAGFTPVIGQEFLIVSAGSRHRDFRSDFEVSGLPAGLAVRLDYLSEGVVAEMVSSP
ncbi:MAG: Ig-like domain-containing protein [Verrucomicrobiales bacterium]|nr:Ig-like domain-containing protein [Verrucomicrobiales bacterium]